MEPPAPPTPGQAARRAVPTTPGTPAETESNFELPADFARLTERQQIALLLKQSEEQSRTPSSKARPPRPAPSPRFEEITPPAKRRKANSEEELRPEHALFAEFCSTSRDEPNLWGPKEHEKFVSLVQGEESHWPAIANAIPGRTAGQCKAYFELLVERGVLITADSAPTPKAKKAKVEEVSEQPGADPQEEEEVDASPKAKESPELRPTRTRSEPVQVAAVSPLPSAEKRRPGRPLKSHKKKEPKTEDMKATPRKRTRKDEEEKPRRDEEVQGFEECFRTLKKQDLDRLAQKITQSLEEEAAQRELERERAVSEIGLTLHTEDCSVDEQREEGVPLQSAVDVDQVLIELHTAERADLERTHKAEGERLAVWFRANAEREACYPLPRALDDAMVHLKTRDPLISMIEGGGPGRRPASVQPPKRRAQKLHKEFERSKREILGRQQHEVSALALTQSWRESGCAVAVVGASVEETLWMYSSANPQQHAELIPNGWPRHKVKIPYHVDT